MYQRHDRFEVLQTGLELISERGYSRLGVDEICKRTGMTKGAFYNAFGSKENFLIRALDTYADAMVERIERAVKDDGATPAIERLRRFYLGTLEHQPKIAFSGCMVNNMMSELAAENDLVADATALHFDRFVATLLPTVVAAQDEGALRDDHAALELAELLHFTFFGALTQARGARDPEPGLRAMDNLFATLQPPNP